MNFLAGCEDRSSEKPTRRKPRRVGQLPQGWRVGGLARQSEILTELWGERRFRQLLRGQLKYSALEILSFSSRRTVQIPRGVRNYPSVRLNAIRLGVEAV